MATLRPDERGQPAHPQGWERRTRVRVQLKLRQMGIKSYGWTILTYDSAAIRRQDTQTKSLLRKADGPSKEGTLRGWHSPALKVGRSVR